MVILTSKGLITQNNINVARKYIFKTYTKAVIVTTASPYKHDNKHIPEIKEQMKKLGLQSVCFDFDTDDLSTLQDFDVMVLLGGNPLYLMKRIKEMHAEEIIRSFGEDKLLIGISAGAMVLGQHLDLIVEFEPSYNHEIQLESFEGLGFTVNVCPHYDRFLNQYERFEERIQHVEDQIEAPIYRLNEDTIYLYPMKEPSKVLRKTVKLLSFISIFSFLTTVVVLVVGSTSNSPGTYQQIRTMALFGILIGLVGLLMLLIGNVIIQSQKRKRF